MIFVVVIWGMNFVFVKLGLDEVSPLLLCALRFFFASIPAVLFIKPPTDSFKTVAAYGIFMFALQFSLVFVAMNIGMTPGMASLIMQVQVFFSMLFAAIVFGDRPSVGQIIGALVAFCGIGVVAFHFDQNVSFLGFICVLGSAASWGIGNLIAKQIKSKNLISVVVWGSFIACFPMFLMSYIFEGSSAFINSYEHLSFKGIGSLCYIVYASTWVGYGIWNWLLSRYPVGVIVPFTLLVPLVGILSSVIVFAEPFQFWKLVSGLLVISGLCINILSARFTGIKIQAKTA